MRPTRLPASLSRLPSSDCLISGQRSDPHFADDAGADAGRRFKPGRGDALTGGGAAHRRERARSAPLRIGSDLARPRISRRKPLRWPARRFMSVAGDWRE